MRTVIDWVQQGKKPTLASIAASYKVVAADFDPAKGCRFKPDFIPQALTARVQACRVFERKKTSINVVVDIHFKEVYRYQT